VTQRPRVRFAIASAALYALAFNVTFFIQELFLVVPKAFVPGLRPTLFHNNHKWTGEHPLANLFQGTGALAILISAVVCTLILRSGRIQSTTLRLFLAWMAFNGFFQALPQFVFGAFVPGNDVGMAMDYFGMSSTAKWIAAAIAIAALVPIGALLARLLLGFEVRLFWSTTLPAVMALPLIVAFRVPREMLEVLLPPVLVTVLGLVCVHATAWRMKDVPAVANQSPPSIAGPLLAVVVLLLVFQLVLRPGIPFY
jgi:hypothetical protein